MMHQFLRLTWAALLGASLIANVGLSFGSPLPSSLIGARSANTCADASLSDIIIQAYIADGVAHILDWRWVYVATNAMGTDWQFQSNAFRAWDTPQPFTVPLFRLVSAGPTLDFMYATGTGTPSTTPVPPAAPAGWRVDGGPFAWVYDTQTCGSVPLMGVSNAIASDHWYTTDAKERDHFVNDAGWFDNGVVAFVLPVA